MEYLNPFNWITPEKYKSIWEMLYYHVFHGFWARFLGLFFLFLGIWIFVRRQNLPLSLIFLSLSFFIAYFGHILAFFIR